MNIHALLSAVADGDMDALGRLYDQLSARIYNYARMLAKESAEDVTHDVFLQINKYAARLAAMDNPESYIFTIARNQCFNLLKRGKRESVSTACLPDVGAPSTAYSRLLFEEAFAALPANRREAVYLHLICGYTHKEVAQMQNVPLVTVKWRYGKALAQLREYFKEESCNECL